MLNANIFHLNIKKLIFLSVIHYKLNFLMFKLIKDIFGFASTDIDINITTNINTKKQVAKSQTPPTCSFCKCPDHKITKCPQITQGIAKIKTYCSSYSNQQNIPATIKWLEQLDEKILNRYVIAYNIDNYMWNNCSQYYMNNIEGKRKKYKLIELIIGYNCVLPLHPEIRIKRVYEEKVNWEKPKPDYSSASSFGTGIIMGTGIAAGMIIVNELN